jgi:hypothetical protein
MLRHHSGDKLQEEAAAIGAGCEHGEEAAAKRVEHVPVPFAFARHALQREAGDAEGGRDVAREQVRIDGIGPLQQVTCAFGTRDRRGFTDIGQAIDRHTQVPPDVRAFPHVEPEAVQNGQSQGQRDFLLRLHTPSPMPFTYTSASIGGVKRLTSTLSRPS